MVWVLILVLLCTAFTGQVIYHLWTTVSLPEKTIFIYFSTLFSGPQITTGFTALPLNLRIPHFFCSYLTKLLWNSNCAIYMKTFGQLCVIRIVECEIVHSLCSIIGIGKSGHFRERNWLTMEKSLVKDNLLGCFKLITNKLTAQTEGLFFSIVFFINM